MRPAVPRRRPLGVDPRPVGRAVPRSLVGHELHAARGPDAGPRTDSVALAPCLPSLTLARLGRKSHGITRG